MAFILLGVKNLKAKSVNHLRDHEGDISRSTSEMENIPNYGTMKNFSAFTVRSMAGMTVWNAAVPAIIAIRLSHAQGSKRTGRSRENNRLVAIEKNAMVDMGMYGAGQNLAFDVPSQ